MKRFIVLLIFSLLPFMLTGCSDIQPQRTEADRIADVKAAMQKAEQSTVLEEVSEEESEEPEEETEEETSKIKIAKRNNVIELTSNGWVRLDY